ncbi:MAG: glycosyltransferase family 9 protein [Rhodospirillaceae bacterium]|jgi:ADP-heptose:LPS heptosyltransferase|nr:glycosyltransferase family 9 protein [Rhodospirillaceae bacterium]MBT4218509.1 glycosyltransferase family 9 protein [Rhodospirillaceae bacterium]MBT4465044.1 glycosyltransferase family 9 protein [Rhodospirillaceae bacterium]MBT5014090.1 glycosyltransferase family 9 protein [Rhodospirillaceae bacterium]MBT5308371.1 glycosyltransferase family 9 protein [Rhodospirillaceae bacterium]
MSNDAILVIKLGALGDFVQALGPMAAIRQHHDNAPVTCLTTAPYVDFARSTGFFDDVWEDTRPGRFNIIGWLALRRRLRSAGFKRVYDLQTSGRSGRYFNLFRPGPMPQWSGIASGCSHPHANPDRDLMHTIDRQVEQLKMAGIDAVPGPESVTGLAGLDADVSEFGLTGDYALLVPGGAPHRPDKRWGTDNYAHLALKLADKNIRSVLLGTGAEADSLARIKAQAPDALDLCGRTNLLQVAGLARHARLAIGNDTGPMHLVSALGCSSIVLYSNTSNPALCGQRGADVTILRKERLDDLGVEEVLAALKAG